VHAARAGADLPDTRPDRDHSRGGKRRYALRPVTVLPGLGGLVHGVEPGGSICMPVGRRRELATAAGIAGGVGNTAAKGAGRAR
jgi:hypothetical protein